MSTKPKPSQGGMVAVYVVWIGLIALSGLAVLEFHSFIQALSLALGLNPWVARAVRQLALPILGLIWLVFIFVMEHRLRTGMQKGLLWRRAGRAAVAVAGSIVVVYAIRVLS
jgi:hypothetical protein